VRKKGTTGGNRKGKEGQLGLSKIYKGVPLFWKKEYRLNPGTGEREKEMTLPMLKRGGEAEQENPHYEFRGGASRQERK